jgi:hypothetical protein
MPFYSLQSEDCLEGSLVPSTGVTDGLVPANHCSGPRAGDLEESGDDLDLDSVSGFGRLFKMGVDGSLSVYENVTLFEVVR